MNRFKGSCAFSFRNCQERNRVCVQAHANGKPVKNPSSVRSGHILGGSPSRGTFPGSPTGDFLPPPRGACWTVVWSGVYFAGRVITLFLGFRWPVRCEGGTGECRRPGPPAGWLPGARGPHGRARDCRGSPVTSCLSGQLQQEGPLGCQPSGS